MLLAIERIERYTTGVERERFLENANLLTRSYGTSF